MKNIMKLAGITAIMALGIAAANAQTTNVTLQLNVALTGFVLGADGSNGVSARLANKDVINALNVIAVNGTNVYHFGKSAKLVVVSSQGQGGGNPSIVVREKTGTNVTDTIIGSDLISVTGPRDNIEVTVGNARYSIQTFAFNDGAGTDFVVDGFSTQRKGRVSARGIGSITNTTTGVTANVAGTGHIGGNGAVLKGNISASSAKAELAQ
jgi:hypothetical protein